MVVNIMKHLLSQVFSDRNTITLLFLMGFSGFTCTVLFHKLSTLSIAVGIVFGTILAHLACNMKFLRIPYKDDSECGKKNLLLFCLYVALLTVFLIYPSWSDMYNLDVDYFYIWVYGASVVYFIGVYSLLLYKILSR